MYTTEWNEECFDHSSMPLTWWISKVDLICNCFKASYWSVSIETDIPDYESIGSGRSVSVDAQTRPNISTNSSRLAGDEDEDGYLKPIPAATEIAHTGQEDTVAVRHHDTGMDSETPPSIPIKSSELAGAADNDRCLKPTPAAAIMADTTETVESGSSYYEPVGAPHSGQDDPAVVPHNETGMDSEYRNKQSCRVWWASWRRRRGWVFETSPTAIAIRTGTPATIKMCCLKMGLLESRIEKILPDTNRII